MRILLCAATLLFSSKMFAGGGPDEGMQNKIYEVPAGFKLVKIDSECKEKDPCEKEKKELEKIKAENKKLKEKIADLQNDMNEFDCPETEPKIIYKTIEKPIYKTIEKPVEKIITKEIPAERKLTIGAMVAYSQDGLETTPTSNPNAKDAYVYRSVIAGPYISIPIGENFEIGAFGMFGGVNQTFGGKVGFSL